MAGTKESLQGKSILITGATDGIGKETAHALAAMGARTIIHGRDPRKTARVKEEVIMASGNRNIEIVVADLQAMANVRALADEIRSRVDHLDVLINNAGTYQQTYQKTTDGFEMNFAVNHLAPFLLTNLLLDLIKDSAPARIITVSSSAHKSARIDLENLNAEKKFHGWGAYCLSKLGNLLFTFALARRLEGSGITANALHPGTIDTKMLAKIGLEGKPVEKGAETPVYLASSPEVSNISGEYFRNKQITEPSEAARDQHLQEKFWQISAKMVNLQE